DAAVAVGFALGVVLPEAGNIGGGGFIVFRDTTGRVRALDYREMAPGGATRAMYVDSTGNPTEQSLTGHLASGVPGSVAGMYEAWKSAGRLPWAKVLAPAIRLAREHTLDAARSRSIAEETDRLARFPASAQQFLVDGHAPPPGAQFRQPEPARTPPFGSAGYVHLEVEAMRRAFMDRNHWLGDPDFVDMPLERLLSKSYAAELRGQILPDRATPTPPLATSTGEGTETTHYSVVDAA